MIHDRWVSSPANSGRWGAGVRAEKSNPRLTQGAKQQSRLTRGGPMWFSLNCARGVRSFFPASQPST
ncbi:hypothetical protein FA086_27815 [Pseudomonas aeruginosa]|nr:hypothetical protein [Pseudomonas aeruginosa]